MILKQIIFRTLCYFCHEIGFSAVDTINKIRRVFPTSYLPRTTLYRYYHDVKTVNDIVLKEPAKLDRVDYTLQTQISDLLTATPYLSNRKISAQLCRSPSTINNYIHKHLQMTLKSCIIIPHKLTPELRQQRIKFAKVMVAILTELREIKYLPLATTDESWLYYYNVPKRVYVKRGETPPSIIRKSISSTKQMYVPVLTAEGVVSEYYVPAKSTINSELWTTNVVRRIHAWWQQKWQHLSSSEREEVKQCVLRALSHAKAVISECNLQQETPLPNEKGLHPSEALLLRRSSKKGLTFHAPTEQLELDIDSMDDQSEEVDHSEDLRLDVEEDEVERRPHLTRQSALLSQTTLEEFTNVYLEETTDTEDYHPPSQRAISHPRRTTAKKQSYSAKRLPSSSTSSCSSSSIPSSSSPSPSSLPSLTEDSPCGCFIHYDNSHVHTSISSRKFIQTTSLIIMPHPAYSPNLAPCDFFYFGALKSHLNASETTNLTTVSHAVSFYNPKHLVDQMDRLFRVSVADGYLDVAQLFESILNYSVCVS